MAVLQSDYSDTIRPGFPGMLANSELQNIISVTCSSATCAFGALVLGGTADHTGISATAETLESAAPAAQSGNTGNGTFAATPAVTSGAKPGIYRLEVTAAAANAGTFMVEDPDGNNVGYGTVGVAFSQGGVAFTLNDGSTDFAVNDGFTFAVAPTGGTDVEGHLGLAVNDQMLGAEVGNYRQGDTMAVMTQGVMWVTAGGTVGRHDDVYFIVSNGRYTNAAAAGRIKVDSCEFYESGTSGNVVRVAMRQRPSH